MNKATQLIIGMVLGFEKSHEVFDGVDWNSDFAGELLQAKSVSKEDVFSPTSSGKSFFAYKQTWENAGKLFKLLRENGEDISIDDLKKPITPEGQSALDMAADCDALKYIFVPELWAGRSDEMEKEWFALDKGKRSDMDFEGIMEQVAALEGRESRTAQLKKMGIDSDEMRLAMRHGDFDKVREKLAAHNDHLRPADVLICDSDGDHGLYLKTSWEHFEALSDEWDKHGETPDAAFFLHKRGDRNTVIDSAFEHGAADKVFNDKVFAGRPDELVKLYSHLKPEQQDKVDIAGVLTAIVEQGCEEMIVIDENLSVSDLTTVLYQPESDVENWNPIIGLGLKKTWDNMDQIRNVLSQKGEHIGADDLRRKCNFTGENCLFRAAKFGHFDKVIDILRDSGEPLQVDDMLARNMSGKNALDVLKDTEQLDLLLDPALWTGRVSELGKLWDNLPSTVKLEKHEAFSETQTRANMMSLRGLQSAPKPGMPGPM